MGECHCCTENILAAQVEASACPYPRCEQVGQMNALGIWEHYTKDGLLCVAAGGLMIFRAVTGWHCARPALHNKAARISVAF